MARRLAQTPNAQGAFDSWPLARQQQAVDALRGVRSQTRREHIIDRQVLHAMRYAEKHPGAVLARNARLRTAARRKLQSPRPRTTYRVRKVRLGRAAGNEAAITRDEIRRAPARRRTTRRSVTYRSG